MFSKYGTITEARVVRTSNRANARSNSFGFVKFEKDEEAAAALAGMQGETFTTEPLVVEYANPAGSSDGNRNRARRGRGNGRRRNNKSDDAEVVEETSGTVTDDEMPTAREE